MSKQEQGKCCGDCPALDDDSLICMLWRIQLKETDDSMFRQYRRCKEVIEFVAS